MLAEPATVRADVVQRLTKGTLWRSGAERKEETLCRQNGDAFLRASS